MSSPTLGVANKKKNQYSTFIDNENYGTNTRSVNTSTKNTTDTNSNASSNTTRPSYSKRLSTSSLHSNYALPPLPDANAASDLQKSKNGTASHSSTRTRLGTVLIRVGTACCPCFSPTRVVSSTPTGGSVDWLWAFGRRLLLAVSLSRASRTEDTRLLQRTASEEEILSKRPRFVRKSNGSSKLEKSDSATSDHLENNEHDTTSKSSSKVSRQGSNDNAILSPDQCEIDEEEDSISSLRSTRIGSDFGGNKSLGGKPAIDGSTGVIPKDPARKRRSRRDQAKIAKTVGKGKPGPSGVVSARFRPPHEIQRTSSASSVINRSTAKSRPSMYPQLKEMYPCSSYFVL
jgi:hypothetical protein